MSLPFTESQVILLRYFRRLKPREIAELLELTPRETRRYLNNGVSRLRETEALTKGGHAE